MEATTADLRDQFAAPGIVGKLVNQLQSEDVLWTKDLPATVHHVHSQRYSKNATVADGKTGRSLGACRALHKRYRIGRNARITCFIIWRHQSCPHV